MNRLRRISMIRPNMADFRANDALPPLSLAILAARTPPEVQVNLYDDKIEAIPADDSPDLVAITVETFTARRAYEIAGHYRARGIPVVMGGYHPTLVPEEAGKHADAIVVGDAEGSWEQLVEDFQRGAMQPLYHGGNERPLDNYTIDRSIFKGKKYPSMQPIQFGRGCRFACDFCSIRAFYPHGHRERSVQSLVREIREIGSRKFYAFVDDNLFNTRESFLALLKQLQPLKIRWGCQISIDVAHDEQLLDALAAAGCKVALIGFESMNEENLQQMGKRWNTVSGAYPDVVRRFHQRGIAIYGTFVFGYDHDTRETLQQMVDFALEAKIAIANFNPLIPTPGTKLYRRLRDEGRLLHDKWWLDPDYRYGDPTFEPRLLAADELAELVFDAKRQFYSWSSMANRILRSPASLNWFSTSVLGMANIISRREILRKQHMRLGV